MPLLNVKCCTAINRFSFYDKLCERQTCFCTRFFYTRNTVPTANCTRIFIVKTEKKLEMIMKNSEKKACIKTKINVRFMEFLIFNQITVNSIQWHDRNVNKFLFYNYFICLVIIFNIFKRYIFLSDQYVCVKCVYFNVTRKIAHPNSHNNFMANRSPLIIHYLKYINARTLGSRMFSILAVLLVCQLFPFYNYREFYILSL